MKWKLPAVTAISFYQDNRSKKALEELEKLNEPLSTVIRNSEAVEIPTHEIVVGDQNGGNEEKTRAMVFSTLIFANILLSFVNRSFFYSMLESFRNRNLLLIGISALVLTMLLVILYVKPISLFFKVTALNISELGMTIFIAAASVLWFEIYKYVKRIRKAKA